MIKAGDEVYHMGMAFVEVGTWASSEKREG